VIPTHKFLDHSFKNWRNMFEGGGRRIKRALHVDMSTIRFLDGEEVERFSRFALLRDYMAAKTKELEEYNTQYRDEPDVVVNARRLTNVGTLRAYIIAYLRNHPQIHSELTFLVRQLAPSPEGLPIEIYVFTKDTRWAYYEAIQADIFDHLLQRERLGSTGIGQGVAIPHAKLASLDKLFGMFARLDKPIDFDAIDDEPVDLVFLLLAPEAAGADHLKALARIARLMRESGTAQKLRASRDAGAIYAVLSRASEPNAA
jgi:mannitol/fructose-specific phosphotransferase system IIA component (Ntr-type)